MIRVNGELLNPDLIEESFARMKAEALQRTQSAGAELDRELMQQAEDEVIGSILIAQEAEKAAALLAAEEVAEQVERLKGLYLQSGISAEVLEAESEQLRKEAEAQLRMERFITARVEKTTEPTEEELRNFFQSCGEDYRSVPEVKCLHLIRLLDGVAAQRDLLAQLTAIRERVQAGADFEELAQAETDKANHQVVLDWVPLDRPENPFEAVLFSLALGELSPVLSYEHAFHLVMVTERRGGELPSFQELREGLRNRYLQEAQQGALRSLVQKLRENASVERVDFQAEA